jgi:hypothetical protein
MIMWVIFEYDNCVLQNVYKQLIDLRVSVVNAESKMHAWSSSNCVYMIYLIELSNQQVPHPSLAIIVFVDPWFVVSLQ